MFYRNRLALMAGEDATGGGGTSSAAVNVGNVDVNELVNKVVGKRVKKAIEAAMGELRGDLMSVVKEAMGQKAADKPADKPVDQATSNQGNTAADSETKLTLKALQDQIQREQKARTDLENRLKEADSRARHERMRSETERRVAAKLGAENPMLGMFMDSFYDTKKRIIEQDGNYFVKLRGADGEEELRHIDDGITAIFDKGGEYNYLSPSNNKVNGLPPKAPVVRGQAIKSQVTTQNGMTSIEQHPIYGVVADAFRSHGDHDKAAHISQTGQFSEASALAEIAARDSRSK